MSSGGTNKSSLHLQAYPCQVFGRTFFRQTRLPFYPSTIKVSFLSFIPMPAMGTSSADDGIVRGTNHRCVTVIVGTGTFGSAMAVTLAL